MKTSTIFLSVLISSAILVMYLSYCVHKIVENKWQQFKLKYNKTYSDQFEEEQRYQIFVKNLNSIVDHNLRYERGLESFEMEINSFADLTDTEFMRISSGFKLSENSEFFCIEPSSFTMNYINIPESINWTALGAVTEVQEQGFCDSSWAFSATGAIEGQHFRLTNQLLPLSAQNLIDCSWKYGNNGCYGGSYDYAFEYVRDNDGIDTEKCYPYVEEDYNICRYNPKCKGEIVKGWKYLTEGCEDELKYAVAIIGPISVSIDASRVSFRFYKEGIYYDSNCCRLGMGNHAMLVVGYATINSTDTTEEFWIIKNSWGKHWGENGYMRLARNQGNHCCIASYASYPIV